MSKTEPKFQIGESVVFVQNDQAIGRVIGIWINEEGTYRYLVRYWTITGKHEDWCVESELGAISDPK